MTRRIDGAVENFAYGICAVVADVTDVEYCIDAEVVRRLRLGEFVYLEVIARIYEHYYLVEIRLYVLYERLFVLGKL